MKARPFLSRINIWFIYILFTAVVSAVVLYSVFLIKELRFRETKRIEVFAKAMQILQGDTNVDSDTQSLLLSIIEENDQLPLVLTDSSRKPVGSLEDGMVRNIPEDIAQDSARLEAYIAEMEDNYEPLKINIAAGDYQLVFYDNSVLLNNLQYYPYFLGLFILAYLFFSIWFMRTMKRKDEGFLWAGLAKETAHQIGTPLSSMIGWVEILRMENEDSMGVKEIEKDIQRLKTISERFSKIGSVPELNDLNLNETVQQNFDYLKGRISTKVDFKLTKPKNEILIPHNQILVSWVLENIVKNAVDAMKGVGQLEIVLHEGNSNIYIDVKDNGSGMTKAQTRNVFKPGYSTKKRGWGLGLSLAKRVINEYHNGDIKVAHTEVGKGTTFRISMKNG